MILTEFDEKSFVEGIKEEADEIAVERTRAEQKDIVTRLKSGESRESIIASGISEEAVKNAEELIAIVESKKV